MSQHMSYSIGFLLIIAMGFYFMYGNPFSYDKVNLTQFQQVCDQYQQAEKGKYKDAEVQMLVNEIYYIIPDAIADIQDPVSKKLKACALQLSQQLTADNESSTDVLAK